MRVDDFKRRAMINDGCCSILHVEQDRIRAGAGVLMKGAFLVWI